MKRLAASLPGQVERTTDLLRAKVIPFVRQPRFWLACITAVAVQVVLALVVTPAQDEPREQIRTAANPWPRPASAPAERIVVPPAQGSHDAVEPADSGKHGTTTPLGAPFDSSEQASTEVDGVDEPSPGPRIAENRRPTEGRQFDGLPVGEADGATLGGIIPLEPMSDSNPNEPRR